MPYISQDKRPAMDRVVYAMSVNDVKVNGDLNYILYKFCRTKVKPSYNNYKNYIGELNECIAEIRRRILSKYENEKCSENGDVE